MPVAKQKKTEKLYLLISGSICLIGGLALILAFWPYAVAVFKGVIGIGFALAGLLLLFFIKN